MNITTTKKALEDALYAAQRVASPNAPLPVLSGVLLSVKGEKLTITGTNLNTTIVSSLALDEVIDEGEVVLPAKYFYELVKRLPDGPINLVRKKMDSVKINYGKQQATINAYSDEYPIVPQIEGAEIEIQAEALLNALQKVTFACATEEIQGVFTGVLFTATPFGVEFTATNRRIASYVNVDDIAVGDSEFKVIIPKAALDYVRLFTDKKIRAVISSNMIAFRGENLLIISKLLVGKFINLTTILPTEFTAECSVNTRELLETLNRAALLDHIVTIEGSKDILVIGSTGEKGSLTESFQVEYNGDPNVISLNIKYLTDALSAAGAKARLKFWGKRACLVEQGSYYCFIAGILKAGTELTEPVSKSA